VRQVWHTAHSEEMKNAHKMLNQRNQDLSTYGKIILEDIFEKYNMTVITFGWLRMRSVSANKVLECFVL
jgi:hypothetical protein